MIFNNLQLFYKQEYIFFLNLPRARGLVSNFCTILSYAISSATPESLTSFSLTAIQML